MPRPLRIEYPNAFYHVMNRGRGRQNIFHSSKYFLSFLDCLSEVHQKFGGIIHAYCLMNNHYHLILETPNSNLSRIMRHINGIYTQRYNRLKNTDGPLFRGRFKAILIDEDSYLLNLNRYIHRNPIQFVKNLEDYKYSSYPAYLNLSQTPKWLNKIQTLEMMDVQNNLAEYRSYIADAEDDFIQKFYDRKVLPAVMGDEDFKKKLCAKKTLSDRFTKHLYDHITVDKIIKAVAIFFEVDVDLIVKRQAIRSKNNFPRRLAMYLCQTYAGNTLRQIQKDFNLNNTGAVSRILFSVRRELENGAYKKEIDQIKCNLYVI